MFNSTTLGQRILKTTYQGSKLISKIPPSSVVNVVYLEGGNFSNEYVLKLQLNPNFLLFSPNDTEIFGIYNNGSYKPLYWYNLTPISYGNSLWINLTNHTPQYLLVAYGEEIKDKYYSASKTFPIAVIPGKINFTYIWIKGKKISTNTYSMISGYIGNNSVKGFGYYSSNPLTISQTGMIPDYVYNTSLNGTEYETFACVYNGKENTEAYIMNVSFYGGNLAYNSQQEIYGYNDIYPEATIIGNYETVTFSAPTGYIITQNNNYHRLCFKEGASWACII